MECHDRNPNKSIGEMASGSAELPAYKRKTEEGRKRRIGKEKQKEDA